MRLPEEQARAVEIACASQGLTKQPFVRTALADHLAEDTSLQASVEAGSGDDCCHWTSSPGRRKV